jgi:asparagine synthase (glutamine-hydrolysing)
MQRHGFIAYIRNLQGSESSPFTLDVEPDWTVWRSRDVQIASYPYVSTPESEGEAQPVQSTRCVLAYEGRLDDRADLVAGLGNPKLSTEPDGTLIVAAYEAGGASFPGNLLGEFCFVLYDKLNRELVAARDPFSPHHLFYAFLPDGAALIASDLTHLRRQLPAQELDPDYFTYSWRERGMPFRGELTPYRGILRLPQGHALTISARGRKISRTWVPDLSTPVRYSSSAEYEEHFRHLLRRAVLNTLRCNGDMVFDVSGGLDSSSITCMAHQLVQEGAAAPRGAIYTYTNVHPNSPTTDESTYWKAVHKQVHGFKHLVVTTDDSGAYTSDLLQAPEPFGGLIYPHYFTAHTTQLRGIRASVKGYGGDEALRGGDMGPYYLAGKLQRGRFGEWYRELRRCWGNEFGLGVLLWYFSLGPIFFPRRVHLGFKPNEYPSWLDPSFVAAVRRLPHERHHVHPEFATNLHYRNSLGTAAARAYHLCDADLRLPSVYRPLVEFMLNVPWEEKFNPKGPSLQQRSIHGVVPDVVSRRQGKAYGQERLIRAAQQSWGRIEELMREPRIAKFGYIDLGGLRKAALQLRHGFWSKELRFFETAMSLEIWLRSLERRPDVARRVISNNEGGR